MPTLSGRHVDFQRLECETTIVALRLTTWLLCRLWCRLLYRCHVWYQSRHSANLLTSVNLADVTNTVLSHVLGVRDGDDDATALGGDSRSGSLERLTAELFQQSVVERTAVFNHVTVLVLSE